MEQIPVTIAAASVPPLTAESLIRRLSRPRVRRFFAGRRQSPYGSYRYMGQEYHLVKLSPASSPDVILTACDARDPFVPAELALKQGLALLAQVIGRFPAVKGRCLPIVFAVLLSPDRAELVDFDLLEDVLQLPVVPLVSSTLGPDDLKAAIAYARKRRFSYDCLDFSPAKLAAETVCPAKKTRLPAGPAGQILLTPFWGSLIFFLLLFFVFWLTSAGSVLLSGPLERSLTALEQGLLASLPLSCGEGTPPALSFLGKVAWGIFQAASCALLVMALPLTIFLFLFFLLEETGLWPRAAFCTDRLFSSCGGCGSQCTAMAAAMGCHMPGIWQCRNIRSPKEKRLAMLAVPLVPCCGRFPALFTMLSFFCATGASRIPAIWATFPAALCLTAFFLAGIALSLGVSLLLSRTAFRRMPPAFVMELPPLILPGKHSRLFPAVWNRTCGVLGKTMVPAVFGGFLTWMLASLSFRGTALFTILTRFLEPLARPLDVDGVILAALLLGIPARETFLPVLIMAYRMPREAALNASWLPMSSLAAVRPLLLANGWTWHTALAAMLLTQFSWPCLTALRAIYRETMSAAWTAAAFLIPTLIGFGSCLAVRGVCALFAAIP